MNFISQFIFVTETRKCESNGLSDTGRGRLATISIDIFSRELRSTFDPYVRSVHLYVVKAMEQYS